MSAPTDSCSPLTATVPCTRQRCASNNRASNDPAAERRRKGAVWKRGIATGIIGLLAVGCQPAKSPTESVHVASPASDATTSPPSPATTTVSVDIQSWSQVQDWIKAQRNKVVVVDIWSTYCMPCMREFPQLVALHRRQADDVACISVAADYFGDPHEPPAAFRDKVLDFLQKQQATFPNVICSDPDEQLFKQLEAVGVPTVLVYDREGVLCKKFTHDEEAYGAEGFTYAQHITPLVEELLKK